MGHIILLTWDKYEDLCRGAKEEASLSLVMAGRSPTHCGGHEASQAQLAGERWLGHTHTQLKWNTTQTTESSVRRLSSTYFNFWISVLQAGIPVLQTGTFAFDLLLTFLSLYIKDENILWGFNNNKHINQSFYATPQLCPLVLSSFPSTLLFCPLLRASELGGKEGQRPHAPHMWKSYIFPFTHSFASNNISKWYTVSKPQEDDWCSTYSETVCGSPCKRNMEFKVYKHLT